jgi:hypothetical protein
MRLRSLRPSRDRTQPMIVHDLPPPPPKKIQNILLKWMPSHIPHTHLRFNITPSRELFFKCSNFKTVQLQIYIRGRDSSVGIASTLRDWTVRGSNPGGRQDFPQPSRPAPGGPTQPPVHWVLGQFPGGKATGAWCWPPTHHLSAEVMKGYGYTSTDPLDLRGLL